MNPHADEAKARWGHTDAWKQSKERVGKMTDADLKAIGAEGNDITTKIAALAEAGKLPTDPMVQKQIDRHYNWLKHFYEPNLELYRDLGSMYVEDPRFAENYERYRPGLAVFMRDAMQAYSAERTA
jgi:hypothetical protein